jgi:hypothetical protein
MATAREPFPPWYLIDTPQPNLFGIGIVIPMQEAGKSPDAWPLEGSSLEEFSLNPTPAIATQDKYGLYQYVGKQCVKSDVVFIFGPYKTEEQKNTPFREVTEKRNHPWPPILYALVFIADYTFLRTGKGYDPATNEISEVVAPNHYVREIFVPGVNEGTKMVKREFFSATKFDIPQTPVPVPTSVSYDINGVQGRFPECLHPKIEIVSTRSGVAQVVAGVVSEVGGALEGQIFPATNFDEWAPYIKSDTQELTEAGWYRVQIIAIPPDPPDVIVQ